MSWLLNAPFSLAWYHFGNFFGKIFAWDLWLTFLLSNLGFLIAILIPGLALSYILQPRALPRALRICFGLALGFVFPLILFYVLGFAHLYYKVAWILASALVSGLSIWRFRGKFLAEWRSEKTKKSAYVFYGFLVLYLLISYIAFFTDGIMDYDILFGQVAPSVHLFFEHAYRPFDMGAVPIVRHELFPGPISVHSAFTMFGATPWVAATAVMVFLAPMMLMMMGKFSEYVFKKSEYLLVFLSLVTFLAFRIKNARGTVLALIFLFGFLLLPKIFEELHEKTDAKLKAILRPVIACALMVALSLYMNIEIGAILLGIMGLVFVGAWLTGRRVLMKTVLFGTAFGFLFFAPWFLTVALLAFGNSLQTIVILYFGIAVLAVALTFLPRLRIDSNLFERILLGLLTLALIVGFMIRAGDSIYRVSDWLKYGSIISTLPLIYYAFKKPDSDRHGFFIYSCLFGVLFIDIYPLLRPFFAQVGLPDKLQYFLFDKEFGSVFPELRAKIHEYFLPTFVLMPLAAALVWIRENWLWNRWIYRAAMFVLFFFGMFRFQGSDFEDYPRGQTFMSTIYYGLAAQYAFDELPVWLSPQAAQIAESLDELKKPGDKIFNFYAVYNPYFAEDNYPYLMTGVGTVGLDKEDLVSEQYTTELLDQVTHAGATYAIFMPGPESPKVWLDDSRVTVVAMSADETYMLVSLWSRY
ncbi:hypothetical protein HY463_01175 [Candidatus Peregrinibacteria bacterium]|nr:hypothetical protein [Candidatus Peregrinibacteria bacterium]